MIDLKVERRQLKVSLLRDQVVALLRDAIVNMTLKPGQQLIERELVELIGVSRATIREALRELAAEGLIVTSPKRGAMVSSLTPVEVEELYEVRARLEGIIAREFATRHTPEQLRALKIAFEAVRLAVTSNASPEQMIDVKNKFYEAYLNGATNATAQSLISSLQARMRVVRFISVSLPGRPATMIQELRELVDAIESHDPDGAEKASELHIRAAAASVVAHLRAQGESGQPGPEPASRP